MPTRRQQAKTSVSGVHHTPPCHIILAETGRFPTSGQRRTGRPRPSIGRLPFVCVPVVRVSYLRSRDGRRPLPPPWNTRPGAHPGHGWFGGACLVVTNEPLTLSLTSGVGVRRRAARGADPLHWIQPSSAKTETATRRTSWTPKKAHREGRNDRTPSLGEPAFAIAPDASDMTIPQATDRIKREEQRNRPFEGDANGNARRSACNHPFRPEVRVPFPTLLPLPLPLSVRTLPHLLDAFCLRSDDAKPSGASHSPEPRSVRRKIDPV